MARKSWSPVLAWVPRKSGHGHRGPHVDHLTATYLVSAARWAGLECRGDLEQVLTSARPCRCEVWASFCGPSALWWQLFGWIFKSELHGPDLQFVLKSRSDLLCSRQCACHLVRDVSPGTRVSDKTCWCSLGGSRCSEVPGGGSGRAEWY